MSAQRHRIGGLVITALVALAPASARAEEPNLAQERNTRRGTWPMVVPYTAHLRLGRAAYPDFIGRPVRREHAVEIEGGVWLVRSVHGALVGAELGLGAVTAYDAHVDEQTPRHEAGYFFAHPRVVIGLYPHRFSAIGGLHVTGRDGSWWDDGGRAAATIGARLLLSNPDPDLYDIEDLRFPIMLEYTLTQPLGELEPTVAAGAIEGRREHRVAARVVLGDVFTALTLTLRYDHNVTRGPGFDEPVTDSSFHVLFGGHFIP